MSDTEIDDVEDVVNDVVKNTPVDANNDAEVASMIAAKAKTGAIRGISPSDAKDLDDNADDMIQDKAMGKNESIDLAFPVIDEDDIKEKKRRFSFSPQEFGRGIVTSPAAKRHRSAKRGLTLSRK